MIFLFAQYRDDIMKLDFSRKESVFEDDYSRMEYAKRHCGFEGAKPFKSNFETAESYADNLKKFLGDPGYETIDRSYRRRNKTR